MHFDLRDLEQFVAVAETGSITRAADQCHTVASVIGKGVAPAPAASHRTSPGCWSGT